MKGTPSSRALSNPSSEHSLDTGSDFDRAVDEVIDVEGSIPTGRDLLGRTLGHYRIIEKIGEGGMGEVYRATDARLGRDVAIKILPEAFARDPERLARFEREARVLASLNHPNIATIHGVEEAEGIRFLVLELVEGETLRDKLADGALPTKSLVRLATQIAEGLAKAHAAGVVHRDLKPENVMLAEDGHAKILDFGLAKTNAEDADLDTAAPTAAIVKTEAGRVMGTTSYMSPEQARGDAVDHRSDQFAFGSVLFEMATGRRAFGGPTAADTLVAIMRDEPERPANFDDLVPPPLRWIIERCLAKEAADRYESTRDLARDLRDVTERLREISDPVSAPRASAGGPAATRDTRPGASPGRRRRVALGVAAATIVAAVFVGVFVGPRLRAPVAPPSPQLDLNRVVVVPFENRTGEADLDVFGLMVADWLTQGMPESAGITFIGSSSAAAAARRVGEGPGMSLDVAKLVDAGTAVTGAYYRQDDLLLIKAEVVAAASGELLHAVGPLSGPISDPMVVVETLRQRVLGLLAGRDPEVAKFTPPTFDAYREFIKGLEIWGEQPEAALEHFQKSSELDPDFLPPRVYSVHALMIAGRRGEAFAVLDDLDDRRAQLSSFERLFVDVLRLYWEHRYNEALPIFRDLVARDPLHQGLRNAYAQAAMYTNRPNEAVSTIEEAAQRQELGWVLHYTLCDALHMLGRHERELEVARGGVAEFPGKPVLTFSEVHALAALGRVEELGRLVEQSFRGVELQRVRLAVEASAELRAHGHPKAALEMAQRVVDEMPPNPARDGWTRWYLATLMLMAERPDDALALSADVASEYPDDALFVGTHGAMAARIGDRRTALDVSRRLEELEDPQLFGADHIVHAGIAAGLGDREKAVEYLREALRAGFPFNLTVHRNPYLVPLWGFEPFEEFLRPKG